MDRDWRWTIRGRRCIGKPPVPRSCSRGLKKSFFAGPRTPETLAGSALRAAHTHMRTSTQVPLRMWHSKKEIQRPDSYISTSEALPPPARLPLFQVPGPGIYVHTEDGASKDTDSPPTKRTSRILPPSTLRYFGYLSLCF